MKLNRTIISYLILAAAAFIFDKIYTILGHGVKSVWMSNMFLYLLGFGVFLFLLLRLFVPDIVYFKGYRLFYNTYNSGVAILINGMLVVGVLEIAGTASFLVYLYFLAGAVFIGTAAVMLVKLLNKRRCYLGL